MLLLMALWVCFFLPFSSSKAAEIEEVFIGDDGWVEVPLDFTFPFYGNSYVTSFMFSNGVVGFLDPNDVPGTGYIHDGLCCDGQNFNGGATGVRFNYTIMPWHTDLIDTGAGRFYTQGDSTYQKYMWENIAEYRYPDRENSFDLTIYPLGNIAMNYTEMAINNHAVTVAIVGDLSAGEYEQWFYNHPTTNGAVFWNNQEDDPIEISTGNSICSVIPDSHISCLYYPESYAEAKYEYECGLSSLYDVGCDGYGEAYITQQCSLDSLWSMACPNFETAYLDQQCDTNPAYSIYCSGYEDAIREEEEEEEEEIFFPPPPEMLIPIEISMPIIDFEPIIEQYEIELPEFEEVRQEEIIAEIEAEIEAFLDPIPEIEPEPVEELEEPIMEELDEPEPEEPEVQEEQEAEESEPEEIEDEEEERNEASQEILDEPVEEEESEELTDEESEESTEESQEVKQIMIAKVDTKAEIKKKKNAKRDKMKEIITNKLKTLAIEMGNAITLEEQKNLQSYILALLNYNAGFNDYKTSLVDGTFYNDKDIYLNKKIPENQKGLRNGLANEILHNKLVDLQWQN